MYTNTTYKALEHCPWLYHLEAPQKGVVEVYKIIYVMKKLVGIPICLFPCPESFLATGNGELVGTDSGWPGKRQMGKPL